MSAPPLRAVISSVPSHFLEWRKRTGAHQWDETWEGILHIPPMPNREHLDLEACLRDFLRRHLRPRGVKVHHERNLASPGGWPDDYRIPDVVCIGPDRKNIEREEYLEGAPDVVVEIESPGDETREKLPFYARIGVPEVWIVDRDTKEPEVHVLRGRAYRRRPAGSGGWIASPFARVEMRARKGKLLMRLRGDDSTLEELPED